MPSHLSCYKIPHKQRKTPWQGSSSHVHRKLQAPTATGRQAQGTVMKWRPSNPKLHCSFCPEWCLTRAKIKSVPETRTDQIWWRGHGVPKQKQLCWKKTQEVNTSICTHLYSFQPTERKQQAVSAKVHLILKIFTIENASRKITVTLLSYSQSTPFFLNPGSFISSPLSGICSSNFTSSTTRQGFKPLRSSPKLPQLPAHKSSHPADFHCMLLSFLLQNWLQSAESHRCLIISGLKLQKSKGLALFIWEAPQ